MIIPEASTVATEASLDDHLNSAPSTRCPFASNASAARRSVSPGVIVSATGITTTEPADCITVTTATPDTSLAVAATVVDPAPAAVTSPTESTTATAVSVLDQDTPTSFIIRRAWSSTSPESCTFCPIAVNATVSGITATVVGTGATTVRSAWPLTPVAVAVTATVPGAIPVTSPVLSTTATSVSADAHVNAVPSTA